MDLVRCVEYLRPDVVWVSNRVNGYSLTTIAETYQSSQAIPTLSECTTAWETIQLDWIKEVQYDRVDDYRDNLFNSAFVYGGRDWDIRQRDMVNIISRKSFAQDSISNYISISSVTDSSGVARFNHSGGTISGEITLYGFSEATYNTTSDITTSGVGYFEISSISFVSDITGSANKYPWTENNKTWIDRNDNQQVFPTPEIFIDFAMSIHEYMTHVYLNARDHKDNIGDLTTYNDVRNYDFTTGWSL